MVGLAILFKSCDLRVEKHCYKVKSLIKEVY